MYKESVYIYVQGVCIYLYTMSLYIIMYKESVYFYVKGVCIYLCTRSLYIFMYRESVYIYIQWVYIHLYNESVYNYVQWVCIYLYTMSLYIIMYRESVREIVESEEFAQVVSDSTRQHFKVHRHTNLTVVSLVIYQRECLQKIKGGYRLTAKKRAFIRF